jgi:pimeloyl-ACP methyl ester carboxylesterase
MYRDIEFQSERDLCAGRLYVPNTKASNGAAIVMAHGFCGTMDSGLFEYAVSFQNKGFHVLVFDYRGFGKSQGSPRQLVSVPRQRKDWKAAIDHVRALDNVDADRVALWGYSFSGGHVIHLAVEDPAIRAIVAQCPLIDPYATMTLANQFRTAEQIAQIEKIALRDWWGGLVGRRPIFINAARDPREPEVASILAAPEADLYLELAGPNWINAVAARSLVSGKFHLNNPSALVDAIKTPTLIQVGDADQSVANESIEIFSRRCGPIVSTKHYDAGHFTIAMPPMFAKVAEDAGKFFLEHLVS